MTTFRFHWKDGSVSVSDGASPTSALSALGFGAGAVCALDYWEKAVPLTCTETDCTNPRITEDEDARLYERFPTRCRMHAHDEAYAERMEGNP